MFASIKVNITTIIPKLFFSLGLSSIFTLAIVRVSSMQLENAPLVMFFSILILIGCVVTVYLLPCVVFRCVPILYLGISIFIIIGTLRQIELSFLGTFLLPLLALSIPEQWTRGKVLLISLPGLVSSFFLNSPAVSLQLALSVCVICWWSECAEGKNPKRTERMTKTGNIILFFLALGIIMAAVKRYGSTPAEAYSTPLIIITSGLLVITTTFLPVYIVLTSEIDNFCVAPTASILATCLLIILTCISERFIWSNFPGLIALAVLLGSNIRWYDEKQQMLHSSHAPSAADDDF